ncbi:MAG: FHA domain-containing protein [Planctomycetes bacterium]|nr:FHA domain-containing protein [Planctomycetota bacterium]
MTVGRSNASDIRVKGLGVSAQHAEIVWDGETPVLRDLDSTNGLIHAGRRVASIALKHGLCVGVGKVNVRIEGPGDEIEIEGDPGLDREALAQTSDETLQFHHVTQVQPPRRRGVGALVGLLVLLLVLAAAAYFGLKPASSRGQGGRLFGTVEPPRDSLLQAGFSAEEAEATEFWLLASPRGSSLSRSPAAARTGRFGYRLERTEEAEPGRPTVAVYREPLRVDARRRYELSAWVRRESGDAEATLMVRFLAPGGEVVFERFGARVRADEPQLVELSPTVPEAVDRVEIGLVAWGGPGALAFDDVVLRPSALAPRTDAHIASRFSIELLPDGVWSLREDRSWLLRRAEYFLESEAERFVQSFFARPGGAGIVQRDGVTQWAGTLAGPEPQAGAFALAIAGADVVTFTYEPWKGAGGKRDGLVLWVRRADVEAGVLAAVGGDVSVQRGPFSMEAVEALVLGTGTRKIRLVLEPPLNAELLEVDRDFRLELSRRHAADEPLVLRLNTSIIDLLAAARTALDKGRDALGHERYGEAYRHLNQLLGEFAVDLGDVDTAHRLIAQVQQEFRGRHAAVKERADRAAFFRDRDEVGAVLQEALALQRAYQKTPVEGEARAIVEKLESLRSELEAGRAAREARALLLLARDAKERGDIGFAEEYYRTVMDRCTGTPFAAEAESELAEMQRVAAELERKSESEPEGRPESRSLR